jgi:hypothetical protein
MMHKETRHFLKSSLIGLLPGTFLYLRSASDESSGINGVTKGLMPASIGHPDGMRRAALTKTLVPISLSVSETS